MKTLHRSSRFKKDYKKLNLKPKYQEILKDTIEKLMKGEPLDERLYDHPLIGDWKNYRGLHIMGDLVLVYKLTKDEVRLARLNTHSTIYKK